MFNQRSVLRLVVAWAFLTLVSPSLTALAQDPTLIPHAQDRPPNDPYPPAEAARRMTVPEGFNVEVVASEPDIVNPVAMTFDERGRVWITESLEYPRRSPGPGRDRVKVLEDTDNDGKADKFTIYADGLNIPSGIAVGHGGVWVANSPDILFLQDTDGDGKADKREVIVTGFGRDDTHELPNSLTWGPDGWLYGWNGVFNRSRVNYRGKTFDFTCAIFRIHPRTRDFELFCEGTSNPWGIAWDQEGSAFASACVIDHLWHLSETGYYHRQGGPYPPFTWKFESIVDHLHQKAAYCGIHFYDSDAYPERYREKLFMGNIHGNCVNVDSLTRRGATYRASAEPDFLTANDAWFMPVVQKTGPDGSLYILDWYDRYHCYQDANRDPAGIDRLKGRLYRIRYKETPRRGSFDLAKESDDKLIDLLSHPNSYDRETARRLLEERPPPASNSRLESIALDQKTPRRTRLNAIWTLISRADLNPDFHRALLSDSDAGLRAWGVRAAGNMHRVSPELRAKVASLATDPNPDVQLQVAIAARKIEGVDALAVLTEVAKASGDDPIIPRTVWQNLLPLLDTESHRFLAMLTHADLKKAPVLASIASRTFSWELAQAKPDPNVISGFLKSWIASADNESFSDAIESLADALREKRIQGPALASVRNALEEMANKSKNEHINNFRFLQAYLNDHNAVAFARSFALDPKQDDTQRGKAFEAFVFAAPPSDAVSVLPSLLNDRNIRGSVDFRSHVLAALDDIELPSVADVILSAYPTLEPELKPRAVELLTHRPSWSLALLNAIGAKAIDPNVLNVNQVRKLQSSRDRELVKQVKARWGTVREGRNPEREFIQRSMRTFLKRTQGDPAAGAEVFKKVCAQCHKLYGEGQDVGPEITRNGRASYDQLLSNVFDPSLVIGASYQGTTIATRNGRVLTGLVVEDSPARVVLKLQGGKTENLPRGEIDEIKLSPLSLMPEDLEKQLKPQELADLFSYITLDKPPTDPTARPIPGAEELIRKAGVR